jgi:hypothetical protein
MKAVKKFSTFDELKSCETKTMKDASSLKKHDDFKKVILDIRAIKIVQDNQRQSKQ